MTSKLSLGMYAAIGTGAASVVIAAYVHGHLGEGLFSHQVALTLGLLCYAPIIAYVLKRLPRWLSCPIFILGMSFVAGPVIYALLTNLFLGHRRKGANAVDATWRVFAILALWILFAKVNEAFIRPWLRTLPIFRGDSDSVNARTARMAHSKRDAALKAIKERLKPVLIRKKKAEQGIVKKKAELEKANVNVGRSEAMVQKVATRLDGADKDSPQYGEIQEELNTLLSMADSAKAYAATISSQIATYENDVKECKELTEEMQKEWTEALHINNHVEFYR